VVGEAENARREAERLREALKSIELKLAEYQRRDAEVRLELDYFENLVWHGDVILSLAGYQRRDAEVRMGRGGVRQCRRR
jgi:hypothetical protein